MLSKTSVLFLSALLVGASLSLPASAADTALGHDPMPQAGGMKGEKAINQNSALPGVRPDNRANGNIQQLSERNDQGYGSGRPGDNGLHRGNDMRRPPRNNGLHRGNDMRRPGDMTRPPRGDMRRPGDMARPPRDDMRRPGDMARPPRGDMRRPMRQDMNRPNDMRRPPLRQDMNRPNDMPRAPRDDMQRNGGNIGGHPAN